MIVVDASVLTTALGDDGRDGDRARVRLSGEVLAAPHLIDLEVSSVWRRMVATGAMDLRRADLALRDLRELPMRRAGHVDLLPRCWELRSNLSTYDAAYVVLAEVLEAPLVTADERLAGAPGIRCSIEVLR